MYVCVLEKFIKLGVPMIARLDAQTEHSSGAFKKLTEVQTCHSKLISIDWRAVAQAA